MLVKEYYKTIELKHNKLHLVDSLLTGKPFERRNPFCEQVETDKPLEELPQISQKIGKKKSNDY